MSMRLSSNSFRSAAVIALALSAFLFPRPSQSAEKEKKPVTQYWMTAATQNMSMPGMSEGMAGLGALFGKMPGLGPTRSLHLQLNSPKALPSGPDATHDIPPAQKMGETLPLLIPEHEKAGPERYEEKEAHEEKIGRASCRER